MTDTNEIKKQIRYCIDSMGEDNIERSLVMLGNFYLRFYNEDRSHTIESFKGVKNDLAKCIIDSQKNDLLMDMENIYKNCRDKCTKLHIDISKYPETLEELTK